MITVEAIYGKFTCYDNDWMVEEIKTCGAYSRPELSIIKSILRPGDTALDVGAHIGTFAVPIKKALGPNGKLFAFEANPETFSLLEKNIADNDVEVIAFNKGVSDQKGTLYLKSRRLQKQKNSQNNELYNSGTDYLVSAKPDDAENIVEVELVKIDDVVPGPVHFIKIDVEGMEINVLRSAQKLIDEFRPIIYSEYHDHYLKRSGENPKEYGRFFKDRKYHFFMNTGSRKASNDEFTLVRIPGPQYIRGQVDFLLVPKESDRYPKNFLCWKSYKPYKFIGNRIKNFLSAFKAMLLGKPG